ncbi:MAG: alpha/beta hydrolase [Dehalococcoidia bacterium]|nr:alpha/beta hydrolase [Dehalococcoidia bacterium]
MDARCTGTGGPVLVRSIPDTARASASSGKPGRRLEVAVPSRHMSRTVADRSTWLETRAAAHFVGCSFGGMVAMEFGVRRHPEWLAALVLSDTAPAPDRPEYDEAFRARERRIAEYISTTRAASGRHCSGRRWRRNCGTPRAAHGLRERYARLSTEGYTGAGHARNTRRDVTDLLGPHLAMPVMLAAGTDDPVYCALPVMADRLPGARQVVFRDTGHGIPSRRPREFADALRRFFDDIQDGRPVARQVTV